MEGRKFTVMEMDGFRVIRIKVETLPPDEPEKATEEEKPEGNESETKEAEKENQ